ncbi:hypothetical protein NQZ79_g8340 [Umbelopsis isabellina]|nr:hypothetical protein NQZ79_g8340 [Umbelopsis isabellina]
MPTLALRGTVTTVPKWAMDVKKTSRGYTKLARCMFHVTDGLRVTCFASDMAILDLLRESDISAGMNVFVTGTVSQSAYTGDDGMPRVSLNMTVEHIELESTIVTSLQEPSRKLTATHGDPVDITFEDLYEYVKSNQSVELTVKTDMKKIKKQLLKEKKESDQKKQEERLLAEKGDGDTSMSSDEDDSWILEGVKRRRQEKKEKERTSAQVNSDSGQKTSISRSRIGPSIIAEGAAREIIAKDIAKFREQL